MKNNVLICAFALSSLTAFAQQTEWLDPNVNAVNRAPMHTNYFAFESEKAALNGCRLASDNYLGLTKLFLPNILVLGLKHPQGCQCHRKFSF